MHSIIDAILRSVQNPGLRKRIRANPGESGDTLNYSSQFERKCNVSPDSSIGSSKKLAQIRHIS